MSEARYMEEQYSEKNIEALEEDLEFLKAEAMLAEYTICNAEGYPVRESILQDLSQVGRRQEETVGKTTACLKSGSKHSALTVDILPMRRSMIFCSLPIMEKWNSSLVR